MPAAVSNRRLLFLVAGVLYALVFVAFVVVGSPSLGIGHFFYLPIALVALATRPRGGIAAGTIGAALYALAAVLNPHISADALTIGTAIRLVNYCSTGALIGWFASRNRRLVDELRILAERDAATGLPNTRAFEASIDTRLAGGEPFALLIGDMGELGGRDEPDNVTVNDALIRLADILRGVLSPGDDLARVGGREFAVLAQAVSLAEASRLAGQLETVLAGQGLSIRFGWAVHPQEGMNALSLYRAADERLYARKLIGADLQSTPLRSVS
jgi:GGDEF domain-containing protein